MTDKTPATEAGRLAVNEEGVRPSLILAIEAEASAKHSQHDYNAGRADALRETAERVRAYKEKFGLPTDPHDLFAAVLAILEQDPSQS